MNNVQLSGNMARYSNKNGSIILAETQSEKTGTVNVMVNA